jgi:universal stress protein A
MSLGTLVAYRTFRGELTSSHKETTMAPIKNMLVPMDFSHASKQALRYACDIANAFDATLHLLHAGENPYVPGGYMEFYAPPPEFIETMERDARRSLESALSDEEKAKNRAVLVYRMGVPAQETLGYLCEQGTIDLVVMSTHGRGGVARLMMGSVADKIIRAAPCPVLTLRVSEHAGTSGRSAA